MARAGLAAANTTQPTVCARTVASLTRLGRDLVADFAVVSLAAMLDATVDSESLNSASCATSCSGSILTRSSSNLPGSSL